MGQGRGLWHGRYFGALFPNFSDERNSAGRIVTGYVVADFFKVEFGEWSFCKRYRAPREPNALEVAGAAQAEVAPVSDGFVDVSAMPLRAS